MYCHIKTKVADQDNYLFTEPDKIYVSESKKKKGAESIQFERTGSDSKYKLYIAYEEHIFDYSHLDEGDENYEEDKKEIIDCEIPLRIICAHDNKKDLFESLKIYFKDESHLYGEDPRKKSYFKKFFEGDDDIYAEASSYHLNPPSDNTYSRNIKIITHKVN
jgi:hypothetical protein